MPEGYEVVERSLDDIRYVLDPSFAPAEIGALDRDVSWGRSLDGSEYMPGLLGLNNMKANDYVNVAVQVDTAVAGDRICGFILCGCIPQHRGLNECLCPWE